MEWSHRKLHDKQNAQYRVHQVHLQPRKRLAYPCGLPQVRHLVLVLDGFELWFRVQLAVSCSRRHAHKEHSSLVRCIL